VKIMAEWNSKANDVFLRAVEIESAADRRLFLDQQCGDDVSLRSQVESLLAASAKVGSFLNKPAGQALPGCRGTVDYEPIAERPGTVIGPYKLMEQIGEGGMGLVFVAEQQHPVRRKVALKIIKPGMDSAQVIARFEAERQALALMDHQNIAKVHDAGTTDSGRPYFVMELVHGVPMTQYCDTNQLTPRQRLELFVPVCQAIQHAHQKGIIHRDIKPSNILVTMYDDRPVPKVIDFGVAKAVEQRLTEKTVYTQFGTLVGTFEYMSPEQAEMNAFGVDTRSDIYALGVLLYELLTGTTPLERPRLREAAFGEIVRLIKEEEPLRPSVRLSTSGALAKVAAARQTEPAKLSRLVRSELDWVVMKCLEKDRSRRYDTASALARDVERYLRDEPVEARSPTVGYRCHKLVRRNKVALTTAGLVSAALLLGTAVSLWQAVQARAERDRARAAEQQAEAEKASAQSTLRFLLADVLEQADPNRGPNRDLTVRALLDKATGRLGENTEMPPLTEAAIRQTIGKIYWGLGEYKKGEPLLARAYQLQRQHAGEDAPDTLDAAFHLATLYRSQSDFAKAEPLFVRVLEARRRLYGDAHRETLRAVDGLAMLYGYQGEPDRAAPLYEKALDVSRKTYGDRDRDTLHLMWALGTTFSQMGRIDEAEQLLVNTLKAQQAVLTDNHPDTQSSRELLAILLLRTRRFTEAEPLLKQAYKDRLEALGEMHPLTFAGQAAIISLYLGQGRRSEADPLMRDLRAKVRGRQEQMPSFVISIIGGVGYDLLQQRDFVEAESFFRLYLDLAEKHGPGVKRHACLAIAALGTSLMGQKKYDDAEPLLLKGYEGLRDVKERIPAPFLQGPLTETLERLVQLYEETHKPVEAAKWRKELEAARLTPKGAKQ
jgi:serine/threonine protein kinase/tetratricopeptide (TPR) repeat protein